MKGWEVRKLGEVAAFRGGGTPSKDVASFWKGNIPWVSPKDMKSLEISSSIDTISLNAVENSATSLIPKGAVLIVVRSGILARTIPVGLTTRELTVNQDIKALCPSKALDGNFLLYFMLASERSILGLVSRGATVHRIETAHLKQIPIPLPPLDEQRRIVAVLDEAFAGLATMRANAEANLKNARALFDSHLNAIFSQKGEGWVKEGLNKHVRFVDYRGKTPPKRDAGIRLITAKNVKMGFIRREPEEFIDPSAYDDWMTRGFPKRGDVLFTTEAPLGNVAQLDTDEKVVIGQRLITMQPAPNILDRKFLAFILMSAPLQELIHAKATGATVLGIKAKLLKFIPISYPKQLVEQRAIADKIEEISLEVARLESLYRQKLAAIDRLKQSILQKAFAGELTSAEIAA